MIMRFVNTVNVLLLLCQYGKSMNDCGSPAICLCSGPVFHLIACHNITSFPTFNNYQKAGVLRIDLFDTQVTILPHFSSETWPRLRCLDVRTNANISCQVIAELQRPGLTILSECSNISTIPTYTTFRETTENTTVKPKSTIKPTTNTFNYVGLILVGMCVGSVILVSGTLYFVQNKETIGF